MSTNPFRRSSLKGPNGSSGGIDNGPITAVPIDIPNSGADTPTQLSVNTRVPTTNQKHVNFASPPAIPISPISYPPSPESARFSPPYIPTRPVLPSPTDYSNAIQSDPFRAEAGTDENDGAIEQALENAKANTTLVASNLEAAKQDAVRNTLSKFASTPRRTTATSQNSGETQSSTTHKQTMDVDAFKRLLLTGDSGASVRPDDVTHAIAVHAPGVMNDNSSGTDTASISQRSLFDQGPITDDSPRSSDEIDTADAENIRQSLALGQSAEAKRRPPPPTPRHGKLIKDDHAAKAINSPMTPNMSSSSSTPRKAPAPPLARRRSQNSDMTYTSSSRKSSVGELDETIEEHEANLKALPPPRSRRPVSMAERRSSSDLPPTVEESDSADSSMPSSRKASDAKPPPPPTRNFSKRASVGAMNPPPPPPPRRGRGSSRSSIDSQRPPMSAILSSGSNTSGQATMEPVRPDGGGRSYSSSSNVNDMLADLAALQREVDEARKKVSQ